MKKSITVLGSVLAMGVMVSQAAMALPVAPAGVHAIFGKSAGVKLVKAHVQNKTSQAVEIKVGDQTMTVAAGATVDVAGADGTAITLVDGIPNHKAGETLATILKSNNDVTFVIG